MGYHAARGRGEGFAYDKGPSGALPRAPVGGSGGKRRPSGPIAPKGQSDPDEAAETSGGRGSARGRREALTVRDD